MSRIPLAFYAPLKSPNHPNPSGDRHIARLLIKALGEAGFDVKLASEYRTRDGSGNKKYQQRLESVGKRWAERLIRRYLSMPFQHRPKIWFTYHLYHKAPDWLGPKVADALNIPYVVAEASYAPKQLNGPWHTGVQGSLKALEKASAVFCLNPIDKHCLSEQFPTLPIHMLAPFLDLNQLPLTPLPKQLLARRWNLKSNQKWLITVAMMRPGDKTESYRILAESLKRLRPSPQQWQMLIIGDGLTRKEVEGYFTPLTDVHFLGQLQPNELLPLLRVSDLYLWPAVNEAFGLSLLEAQATGTGILAGNEGGVSSIVSEGITAELAKPRSVSDFTAKLETLLSNPAQLKLMGLAARDHILQHHDLTAAAKTLKQRLTPLL
ncbi:glycosyltransferase family 4 protein [Motiliproteus sp. MSK22-1]|uniref:glycosyltransferase family 4 protein n=1 Tax=Motiliproteus sp. MSK22-1 TaxID=1897630 RepID=UPI000978500B|nr:glycosyltransferase family 4 protein [Motiliproteus sp. MSK22-1]OMH39743.1 hypothetical protein BGP75_01400 [Motiliproteus sp. MSK22-1]